MSKHTPGPLYASGNGVHTRRGTVGYCTAVAHDPDEPSRCTDVAIANARLYAAAPDLLTACEAMLKHAWTDTDDLDWQKIGSDTEFARAAIAKARGEAANA